MKKIVKPLFFGALLLVSVSSLIAQPKALPAEDFGADMKKVIREYPHDFAIFIGDTLEQNPQSTDFASTFVPAGTNSASVTRYSAKNKTVYSWQAVVLTTDDYELAKEKYKALYTRFNNMGIKMDYGVTFYLKGHYQAPAEERNFSSSVLHFDQADRITSKMKLEVCMQYELMEWTVRVIIYERDREDTERGEILE